MNRNTRHRRPGFDSLDSRLLLDAGLSASLVKGVLTIRGTAAADEIDVIINAPRPGRRGGPIVVEGLSRSFPSAQVRQIRVMGRAGDDTISVENRGWRSISTRIVGGAGNDTINGVADFPTLAAPTPATITPPVTPTPPDSPTPPVTIPPPVTSAPPIVPTPSTTDSLLSAIEQRIVELTNAERLKVGLAPMAVDAKLVEAAKIQAGNMARLDVMSHELPGTSTPNPVDRANAVGYAYRRLAENIAYNYAGSDEVVEGWMNSPGHRANILDSQLTEIGVAVALNDRGEPYYAQVFGTPA